MGMLSSTTMTQQDVTVPNHEVDLAQPSPMPKESTCSAYEVAVDVNDAHAEDGKAEGKLHLTMWQNLWHLFLTVCLSALLGLAVYLSVRLAMFKSSELGRASESAAGCPYTGIGQLKNQMGSEEINEFIARLEEAGPMESTDEQTFGKGWRQADAVLRELETRMSSEEIQQLLGDCDAQEIRARLEAAGIPVPTESTEELPLGWQRARAVLRELETRMSSEEIQQLLGDCDAQEIRAR